MIAYSEESRANRLGKPRKRRRECRRKRRGMGERKKKIKKLHNSIFMQNNNWLSQVYTATVTLIHEHVIIINTTCT